MSYPAFPVPPRRRPIWPWLLVAGALCAVLVGALAAVVVDRGDDDARGTDAPTAEVIGEDAAVAWSATFEEDWSPVDVVQVGDVLVVSQSWSIDEGSSVLAYDAADGRRLWSYGNTYGSPLVAAVDDTVLVCSDTEVIDPVYLDPETGEETGTADAEECDSPGDDETGTKFGGKGGPLIDRYQVSGSTLTVLDEDGSALYDVALQDADPEIWTVDGAVVTFTEETWELRFYA